MYKFLILYLLILMMKYISKDEIYNNIIITNVFKIPVKNSINSIGDESGMEGNIILDNSTGLFCYHNGITWVCLGDNTVINVGIGVGVYVDLSGPDPFQFKSLFSNNANLTITDNNNTIFFDIITFTGPTGDTGPTGVTGPTGSNANAPWTVVSPNFIQNINYTDAIVNFGTNNLLFGSDILDSGGIPQYNTKMFFIADTTTPGLGSFRAGTVTGNQWDAGNRGPNSVAFGVNNISSNANTFVGGGNNNSVLGTGAFIGAGGFNNVSGYNSSIGAGNLNNVSGDWSAISAGNLNTITGEESAIGAGQSNNVSGFSSSIGAGGFNNVSGYNSSLGAGKFNDISGWHSSLGAGQSNNVSGDFSAISAGDSNNVSGDFSAISAGDSNNVSGERSAISAGQSNTISGWNSAICAGHSNTILGKYSGIFIGKSNTIEEYDYNSPPELVVNSSILAGQNLILNQKDTAMVQNLRVGDQTKSSPPFTQPTGGVQFQSIRIATDNIVLTNEDHTIIAKPPNETVLIIDLPDSSIAVIGQRYYIKGIIPDTSPTTNVIVRANPNTVEIRTDGISLPSNEFSFIDNNVISVILIYSESQIWDVIAVF